MKRSIQEQPSIGCFITKYYISLQPFSRATLWGLIMSPYSKLWRDKAISKAKCAPQWSWTRTYKQRCTQITNLKQGGWRAARARILNHAFHILPPSHICVHSGEALASQPCSVVCYCSCHLAWEHLRQERPCRTRSVPDKGEREREREMSDGVCFQESVSN